MMAICYQKAIFSVQTDHIFGESHPRKIEVPIPQKDRNILIGKFGGDKGMNKMNGKGLPSCGQNQCTPYANFASLQ